MARARKSSASSSAPAANHGNRRANFGSSTRSMPMNGENFPAQNGGHAFFVSVSPASGTADQPNSCRGVNDRIAVFSNCFSWESSFTARRSSPGHGCGRLEPRLSKGGCGASSRRRLACPPSIQHVGAAGKGRRKSPARSSGHASFSTRSLRSGVTGRRGLPTRRDQARAETFALPRSQFQSRLRAILSRSFPKACARWRIWFFTSSPSSANDS